MKTFAASLLLLVGLAVVLCETRAAFVQATGASTSSAVSFNLSRVVATGLGGVFEVTLDVGTLTDGTFCNFSHPKFVAMTAALNYSYIRIGGTEGDYAFYDLDDNSTAFPQSPPPAPFTRKLSAGVWSEYMRFARKVNARTVFGLNAGPFVRDASTNAWNASMAATFVQHNTRRFPGEIAGYEFGNEPNLYPFNFHNPIVNGTQWAADMKTLRQVLDAAEPRLLSICCDVTYMPLIGELLPFVQQFTAAGGHQYTNITTYHYYPLFSDKMNNYIPEWIDIYFATPSRLAMPLTLNEADKWAAQFDRDSSTAADTPLPIRWLGESASACFGGQPGVSDRFVDSLAELDKAGLLTRRGQTKVFRQELCATHWTNGNKSDTNQTVTAPPYAIINRDFTPRPTYFMVWLFRAMVGGRAFASLSSFDDMLRAYAYEAKDDDSHAVLALINPGPNTPAPRLCFTHGTGPTEGDSVELYELTGCVGNLTSESVCANGRMMKVNDVGVPDPVVAERTILRSVNSSTPMEHCFVVGAPPRQMLPHSAWLLRTPK